ncbi:MAG TPA: response regulator transcription factor [Polyangiaceae bacterium]
MAKHVLIVDDEKRIREVVEYALQKDGFRVSSAVDGLAALAAVELDPPDLVVLDVMLPGLDGLAVCRKIRSLRQTPILFLSARADEVDRIVGLELGGDDYMVKPFSPRELVARVRAVLRRFEVALSDPSMESESRALCHGQLKLDIERHEASFAGQRVQLTATEFQVLAALIERPGIVLSRAQLLQRAYAYDLHVTERTLDSHVRRIRAKFRGVGGDPIATVHGVGYKASDA